MNAVFSLLPWLVSLLAAAGIIGMQCLGGGGRPMFPLLVCYLPVLGAGLLALPLTLSDAFPRTRSRESARIPSLPLLSTALLGAYLLGRTLFGGDPGLRDFELLRLGGLFLLYLVFAVAVTHSAARLFFLLLILLAAFSQTAFELYQFYSDGSWEPISGILTQLRNYYPTTVGTYANKNHLAWLLGDATLVALALGCWGRLRWSTRGLALYCAAFCSLGVFLSLSRGGVVALGVGVLVFVLLSFYLLVSSGNRTALLVGCLGVLVISLLAFAVRGLVGGNLLVSERMQRLWIDVFREDLWRAAIHDLALAPFFGMGAGSFQWSARVMMPHDSLLAHNDFAQLLSEYGLVGLLLLIFVLGIHLWCGGKSLLRIQRAFNAPRESKESKESMGKLDLWSNKLAITIGALSMAVAQITHSFLDFNMHLGANALLAGVCFGLLGNSGLSGNHQDVFSRWGRWGGSALIAFLVLFLSLLVARNWRSERCLFAVEAILAPSTLTAKPPTPEQLTLGIEAALLACEDDPRELELGLGLGRWFGFGRGLGLGSARHAAVLSSLLWFRVTQNAYLQTQEFLDKEGERGRGDGLEQIEQMKQKDLALLAIVLRRTVAMDPEDWYARMRLGGVLARVGDESGSRTAFLGAMQRLPLYALTYQEYAASLRDLGSLSEARHYYRVSSRFKDAGAVREQLKDLEKQIKEKLFNTSLESDASTSSGDSKTSREPVSTPK